MTNNIFIKYINKTIEIQTIKHHYNNNQNIFYRQNDYCLVDDKS